MSRQNKIIVSSQRSQSAQYKLRKKSDIVMNIFLKAIDNMRKINEEVNEELEIIENEVSMLEEINIELQGQKNRNEVFIENMEKMIPSQHD